MSCVYLGGRVNLTFVLTLPIFPTVVFFNYAFYIFYIFAFFVFLYYCTFCTFCTFVLRRLALKLARLVIGYFGLIDHETNFEINLFFSSQKRSDTWKILILFHISIWWIKAMKWRIQKFLSVRPTTLKNKKSFNVFIMFFRAFWVLLINLLRGWDWGRPRYPLLGRIPNIHLFYLKPPLKHFLHFYFFHIFLSFCVLCF